MLLSHSPSECLSALVGVKPTRYSALVTQDDGWPARMAQLVAREVRRYRESRRPRMSAQQLEERTAELGMRIPRSVLANLESGRRETVSAAEVLVLAAALDVAPIELICPVGFDKQTEMLPGRMMDPLAAMRWVTGELKLDVTEAVTTLREPGPGEQSSTHLLEYHDELIGRLRAQEAEARRAVADAASQGDDERARREAGYRVMAVSEWRAFIREPLRRTRAEMRERGMLVPDLPADIELGEEV
jgi:transcriptional regulator with XRE-family HTH domain